MRVFNIEKTQELTQYDLTKGYLQNDKLLIKHHEAQEEVKEKYHYETIKEYENGGKDIKKVIDIAGIPAKEAYDEFEDISIYVPYTQQELDKQLVEKKQNRLAELTKDFAQVEAGLIIEDIEERKSEFRTLLNEIRILQGKEPRKEQ